MFTQAIFLNEFSKTDRLNHKKTKQKNNPFPRFLKLEFLGVVSVLKLTQQSN